MILTAFWVIKPTWFYFRFPPKVLYTIAVDITEGDEVAAGQSVLPNCRLTSERNFTEPWFNSPKTISTLV